MCGIVGIIARKAPLSPDLLERATRSLGHRGPDDSGTTILHDGDIDIGLGNRRLAILDLSALGHQPMQDPQSGNWIVYNGEIYNFQEIRRELEREGVPFSSHSDTEVVLKAYARWHVGCLKRFRGMFAFAIWDARRHELFLARDPMGIKPLYYSSSDTHFAFASEIRTLLGTGLIPRKLSRPGLLTYLTFGSVYDPNTIIDGISALGAGQYLRWQNGKAEVVTYWELGSFSHARDVSESRTPDIQAMLEESLRLHMVSDVPVGVFLSGGIDSSAIVGLLSRLGQRVKTFSLVFREADFSEAEYSRIIAQKFGTEHKEISVSQQDVLDAIPGALHAMDQPTIDGINTYFISRQTRAAGVKVALSGLGGDELFAGYSTFRTVPQMEHFARRWKYAPAFLRPALAHIFRTLSRDTDQNRKLFELAIANGGLIHPYFLSRMLFTPSQRRRLSMGHDEEAETQAYGSLQEVLRPAENLDEINRVSYLETRCYMLNTLLRDSDFMSMAHGLELRVPFVDKTLADLLFGVPGKAKLDQRTPKPLLVRTLGDALPDEIVYRRKQGFTLPFEHWLRQELRPAMENAVGRISRGSLASVFNADAGSQVWEQFLDGKTSWSRPWSLFVLQRWCDLNSVAA